MRHPVRLRHLAAVAAVIVPLAVANRARADVVPDKRPDDPPCTAPGQPCLTDPTERTLDRENGTCVATTCTKQVRMRDGSTTPVGIPCFECKAAPAKGSTAPPKSRSSGCAVAPDSTGTGSLAVVALLIAGAIKRRARLRA
jgi:MYXO-CTERM domain-containing protein